MNKQELIEWLENKQNIKILKYPAIIRQLSKYCNRVVVQKDLDGFKELDGVEVILIKEIS